MIDLCHLCRSPLDQAVTIATEGRTGPLHTVACDMCGLVQTVPHPTAEEVADYYASGAYRREFPDLPMPLLNEDLTYAGRMVEPGSPEYETAKDRIGMHAARRLVGDYKIEPSDKVLEIGCGDGRVAGALRFHCFTIAVEADPNKRAEAEARGVTVAEPGVVLPGQQDFVYALQVAEHFADPIGQLRTEIVEMAKVGGVVVVEVPTVERPYVSLTHFFQKPHVASYSSDTLKAALEMAGLGQVTTRIEGSILIGCGVRLAEPDPVSMPWAGPGTGQRVADGLHAWQVAQDDAEAKRAPQLAMTKMLDGDDLTPRELDLCREELRRYASTGAEAILSLSALVKMLDAHTLPDWHADPWVRGYYAGRIYERGACAQLMGHLLDELHLGLNRPIEFWGQGSIGWAPRTRTACVVHALSADSVEHIRARRAAGVMTLVVCEGGHDDAREAAHGWAIVEDGKVKERGGAW